MKRFLSQFHAKPEELYQFIADLRDDVGCSLAIIGWQPFSLNIIDESEEIDPNIFKTGNERFLRIALSNNQLVLAESEGSFFDRNPNVVTLDIGRLSPDGLEESALSFGSDEDDAIVFAKKAFSKLKKITSAGVVAVNPSTGAEGRVRTHRYTLGAKELFERGITMKSLGGCIYKFGD